MNEAYSVSPGLKLLNRFIRVEISLRAAAQCCFCERKTIDS